MSYRRSFHEDNGFPRRHGGKRCDRPSELRQFWIPCQDCDGFLRECQTCNGYGFEAIFDCPWCSVDPDVAELFLLHVHWPAALPDAGGIYDQPAGYVQAMRFLDGSKARMEEEIRGEEERARRAEAMRGRPGKG